MESHTHASLGDEIIRLEDIYKTYHLGEVEVPVLRGVSLSIAQGELVALMGSSGSGKTTLMNLLGCLDRPSSGEYWFAGRKMSGLSPNERALVRTENLGFVFQSFNLLARTTALENVLMPLDYGAGQMSPAESQRWGRSLLERVGLGDRVDHEPSQMSGGQQQRVAVARSLVNRPQLILADEPTGNLDSKTSVEILKMFQELNAEGITVILVTHDPKVASYASRVIRVKDGQIESDDPGEYTPVGRGRTAPTGADAQPQAAVQGKSAGVLPTLMPRTLRTAFSALWRNKLRSALTTLGVIIGVGAVIAMMEIGGGSKAAIQKTIASMGANNMQVQSGAASSGGVSFGSGSVLTLTPEDAEEISKQCPAVEVVAPLVRARTQVVFGSRNWVPTFIYGTTPGFLAARDWEEMQDGAMFTERDVRNAS